MTTHSHGHESSAGASNRVKELVAQLERRGITTESELDRIVEKFLLKATPLNGAHLVARAWSDPAFKARLIADAGAAIAELGIDMSHWAPVKVRAVENTAREHNVIVCTLCSCYPIALLGPSPAWYKSEGYRSRVVRDPRGVLTEFGLSLDSSVHVSVWDSTAELRYIVVPLRPPGTEGFTEEQLAKLVTRNGLIGTAAV
ncbi:MAG TPA: nitrile hydratase subunit alpha [Candidatus Acidoferrum sp.]|nr:nitrile hydratase subunit alpha [Candidatus Acidoferrum sp.]